MIQYYFLVKIPTKKTKHWIEVGINFRLPFHPNLTDELEVLGFPCQIDSISYTPETLIHGDSPIIRATAVDCLYSGVNEQDAIKHLNKEYFDLKESYGHVILNDASDWVAFKIP